MLPDSEILLIGVLNPKLLNNLLASCLLDILLLLYNTLYILIKELLLLYLPLEPEGFYFKVFSTIQTLQ